MNHDTLQTILSAVPYILIGASMYLSSYNILPTRFLSQEQLAIISNEFHGVNWIATNLVPLALRISSG